jgi:hypothetical protein
MSNLIKAQATSQFAWYSHRTSFCANGMPDKLIGAGLRQPNRIKFSFEEGSMEIKLNLKILQN